MNNDELAGVDRALKRFHQSITAMVESVGAAQFATRGAAKDVARSFEAVAARNDGVNAALREFEAEVGKLADVVRERVKGHG